MHRSSCTLWQALRPDTLAPTPFVIQRTSTVRRNSAITLPPAHGIADPAAISNGHERHVGGLTVASFAIPDSCVAPYHPEVNALIPADQYDLASKTPAFKGIPVRIEAGVPAQL